MLLLEQEMVELLPVGPNATTAELNLRSSLMTALISAIGVNSSKKAVNATADVIHVIGNIITSALNVRLRLTLRCVHYYCIVIVIANIIILMTVISSSYWCCGRLCGKAFC